MPGSVTTGPSVVTISVPILRRAAKTICALLRRNYGWREYNHQPTARFPRLSFAGNVNSWCSDRGGLIRLPPLSPAYKELRAIYLRAFGNRTRCPSFPAIKPPQASFWSAARKIVHAKTGRGGAPLWPRCRRWRWYYSYAITLSRLRLTVRACS